MSKRKVCVVVGSRANYGRIKSVLRAVRAHQDLELQLVVGASALLYRFGSAIDIIRADGFEPDASVYYSLEGENPAIMAKSTGLAIVELATTFQNLAPDIVLTVADRYETLANAVAASYMNITVAHTQGGEVSGSIDESVRHAITKLSHLHFPATRRAKEVLLRMGEDPERVFLTGCPAMDLVTDTDLTLDAATVAKYGGAGAELDFSKPYCILIQHPVTTEYGSGAAQVAQTVRAVEGLGEMGMQVVWLWPNIDAGSDDLSKGMRTYREQKNPRHVRFYRNFAPDDYLKFLANASCILGNSSSGLRESALLGTPTVNIGDRQALRERGANVIDVGHSAEEILAAAKKQFEHGRYAPDDTYGDGHAGPRIAEALASAPLEVKKRLHYDIIA